MKDGGRKLRKIREKHDGRGEGIDWRGGDCARLPGSPGWPELGVHAPGVERIPHADVAEGPNS